MRKSALILVVATGLLLRVPLWADAGKWVGTWVSAQQVVEPGNMPPAPGLAGHSLRQIIQPSLDGSQIRLTFSNQYGESPLTLGAVTIGRSLGEAKVDAGSLQRVTFNDRPETTLLPGMVMLSDPIKFEVRAFENLAVTAHCVAAPATVTGHPGSRTTSYLVAGDQTAAADLPAAAGTDHWYLLAAADVWADSSAAAMVVIGDSITDGRGSTTNHNDRWPNRLARRLQADPRTANIAVLNQGIGGNRILRRGLGPPAIERFDRDVLVPPGVRWLIVFEGINDIGTALKAREKGEPAATSAEIIDALHQMIERAHAHGIRVFGATVMPFAGFTSYYSPETEADRQAVNEWIRQPGHFDGLIDFDAIVRDPQDPHKLSTAVDGGDHLHPSAAGYGVMAEAIDLGLFDSAQDRR